MTFCQKNVHSSFLAFPNATGNGTVDLDTLFHCPNNSYLKSILFPPPLSTGDSMMTATKRDPGGIGFIDDIGGSVDGLMSCTESLGFESSDERRVDDQIEGLNFEMGDSRRESSFGGNSKWKREHVRREVKKFPPPLSSLDQNGKPTFFLRPVRKDGRLELQEVKISRPEILFASREDGRLRLHLISSEEDEDCGEQIDEEKGEEAGLIQEMDEDAQEMIETELEEESMIGEYIEEEGLEERVEEWQIPVSPGSGEGFGRCHEMVSHHQNHRPNRLHHHHHHHHGLHVWRQHCLTIR